MPKHKSDKVWVMRKEGQSNGYVKTFDTKSLHIYYYQDSADVSTITDFVISRNDARTLAKRIMECLDDTK